MRETLWKEFILSCAYRLEITSLAARIPYKLQDFFPFRFLHYYETGSPKSDTPWRQQQTTVTERRPYLLTVISPVVMGTRTDGLQGCHHEKM